MVINYQVRPVNPQAPYPRTQVGRIDAGSGLVAFGEGIAAFGQGMARYLNHADQVEQTNKALDLSDKTRINQAEAFRKIREETQDPDVIAKRETEALVKLRHQMVAEAQKLGVGQQYMQLMGKHFFNEQADILTRAQQTSGAYAHMRMAESVRGFHEKFTQAIDESIVSADPNTGVYDVNLTIDAYRHLSGEMEGVKANIRRALTSVPPEKVAETIEQINQGTENAIAKTLMAKLPQGKITSTLLDKEVNVPYFTMANGELALTHRRLTGPEKTDMIMKVQGHLGAIRSNIDYEDARKKQEQQDRYHELQETIRSQYAKLGTDLNVESLVSEVTVRNDLRAEDKGNLFKELTQVNDAIKTAKQANTDKNLFMDLLFRIDMDDQDNPVRVGEIIEGASQGRLNDQDFRFLHGQLQQKKTRASNAFDKQFKETIDAVEGLFVTMDNRTIIGDKVSEYKLYLVQKALELRQGLTGDQREDPQQANRVVLQAAQDILPVLMANQRDSGGGIEKSRFGQFFQHMAGGDISTARAILATTPGLTTQQRINMEFGIAGMEAVQGIQQKIQSGQSTTWQQLREPHKALEPAEPGTTVIPHMRGQVKQHEDARSEFMKRYEATRERVRQRMQQEAEEKARQQQERQP